MQFTSSENYLLVAGVWNGERYVGYCSWSAWGPWCSSSPGWTRVSGKCQDSEDTRHGTRTCPACLPTLRKAHWNIRKMGWYEWEIPGSKNLGRSLWNVEVHMCMYQRVLLIFPLHAFPRLSFSPKIKSWGGRGSQSIIYFTLVSLKDDLLVALFTLTAG